MTSLPDRILMLPELKPELRLSWEFDLASVNINLENDILTPENTGITTGKSWFEIGTRSLSGFYRHNIMEIFPSVRLNNGVFKGCAFIYCRNFPEKGPFSKTSRNIFRFENDLMTKAGTWKGWASYVFYPLVRIGGKESYGQRKDYQWAFAVIDDGTMVA